MAKQRKIKRIGSKAEKLGHPEPLRIPKDYMANSAKFDLKKIEKNLESTLENCPICNTKTILMHVSRSDRRIACYRCSEEIKESFSFTKFARERMKGKK